MLFVVLVGTVEFPALFESRVLTTADIWSTASVTDYVCSGKKKEERTHENWKN